MVNVSCLCRMKEIEGVRTIKLVDVGGVLRMGSDLLLMSVWRLLLLSSLFQVGTK